MDLSQALIPANEQSECYFRFPTVCFCFLQTLCVRQSLNGCLSVDDFSIAANRYCRDLVSHEHWKRLNCHTERESPHNCHPPVHAGKKNL